MRGRRERLNRFIERHQKQLGLELTAFVMLLGFIGSYQYYTGYAAGVADDRLWSAVLYSTLKLYVFSPTAPPGGGTPVLYEIAKWAAPLCTAYWIFQAAESLFYHSLGLLNRKLRGKKQILVFGCHGASLTFLKNLTEEGREDVQLVLASEEPVPKETRLRLERNGVLVCPLHPAGENPEAFRRDMRRLRPEQAEALVLFYPDPTRSFTLLTEILDYAEETRDRWEHVRGSIGCAVWCGDRAMKKIITDCYDRRKGLKPFNLNVFDMPDMAAADLFQKKPLFQNCLAQAVQEAGGVPADADTLLQKIPQPHVLIVGFGRYGQAVLEKVLLTGTLSDRSQVKGYKRLRVTIVDQDSRRCREDVEARYPRIDKLCRITYAQADIRNIQFGKILPALPVPTYAVICFSDQTLCVGAMEKLRAYLNVRELQAASGCRQRLPVPVAVRMKEDDAVIRFRKRELEAREGECAEVFSFGTEHRLLTSAGVLRYEPEARARRFHQEYRRISSQITGQAEPELSMDEIWGRLDFEKKESARAQVLNQPYAKALVSCLAPLPDSRQILEGGEDTEKLLARLDACPDLDVLSALEHRRWNNFCYTYGYVGHDPDEKEKGRRHRIEENGVSYYGKVHNCLLDSWQQLREDPSTSGKVIYDVCSVYGYGAF